VEHVVGGVEEPGLVVAGVGEEDAEPGDVGEEGEEDGEGEEEGEVEEAACAGGGLGVGRWVSCVRDVQVVPPLGVG
jgi:hypothetical protein